ncbi:MAG TPA: hypothetical protein DDX39_08260 [Bacteroidales bacterium]|nr:MAG: hypothetical protein A2W98_09730 [Bacteroidetes bacterium GWF2_33_38]OFY75076.1 MAG: hypothetical protein A2265_06200 [Bacteroidetes bacterium RIFOXYA12_FULL_33_9]HBF88619.1 hypothetical protein [Bacteroidales bacterium]
MKFGIANISSIPLRREPAESSEMMTEILFGEHFEIVELIDRWAKIKLNFDNYIGWIDKKMIQEITEEFFNGITQNNTFVSQLFINNIENKSTKQTFYIGGGSSFPFFRNETKCFFLGEHEYELLEDIKSCSSCDIRKRIIDSAMQYMNSAYLWGGRNPFGIDCSGLTQVAYKIHGININRDARKQIEHGSNIDFIDNAKNADLAFFDNSDGIITHVGLVLEGGKILHASGKVRIDKLDHQGIYNEERKIYTHKLRMIKDILG